MNKTQELINRINELQFPGVVGLDPSLKVVPKEMEYWLTTEKYVNENLFSFCKNIIDAIHDIVPAVKPNIAFFERYLAYDAFHKVCQYAKSKGLFVIADIKREDIGTTAEAYADAYLTKDYIDFVTLSPYVGTDNLKPFLNKAIEFNKGIFALVKTSNSSASEFQDLLVDGKPLFEYVADKVVEWNNYCRDTEGFGRVGAVVGCTHPTQATELRKKYPNVFFLVPGYGTQGGTAEDAKVNFINGVGGIVNSSSAILGAHKKSEEDFCTATRNAVLKMKDDLNICLT